MSVTGSPSAWADLLEQILPDILESVVDSWDKLKIPLRNTRENAVTQALCLVLRHNRKVRELPVDVVYQYYELEPADGEDIGILDIAFLPTGLKGSPNESIYFGLECKWLNVIANGIKRPQGSEYVKDGMLRYITGKYAKAVKHGGMVGYVLDGDVPSAIANVENNIQRHYALLQMDEPGILHLSSIMNHLSNARESFHNRNGKPKSFCIHHIFVNADKLLDD